MCIDSREHCHISPSVEHFACGGHIASFSKPFILQVRSDFYVIYAPESVSVISEVFLLSELLPPCSFETTQFESCGFFLVVVSMLQRFQ